MSNPIILELKKSNASKVINASDYVCTLPYPIPVEPGSEVSLKMISIDSQVADSNTIVISETLNLSAQFSYYEYDLPPYDPSDNFVKRDHAAGNPKHNPTFKWCAAYTEPAVYQFVYQELTASNFVPKTPGLLGYQYALKNTDIFERDNVTGKFNYTRPFETNQVWSEFKIKKAKPERTSSGSFDGGQYVYYDASKPTKVTDIKPDDVTFDDEGIRGKGGAAPLDATFYRIVTITNTLQFFDLSGNVQSLTAKKDTDINDPQSGGTVRFIAADFQIRDGVPWDGRHAGTQLNSVFSATYKDYVNNIGFIQSGDDTKHVTITDTVDNAIGVLPQKQLIIDRHHVQIFPGRYEQQSISRLVTRGFDTTGIKTDFSGIELRYPSNPLLTRLDVAKGVRVVFKNMMGNPLNNGRIDFSASDAYFYDDACANRTLGAAIFSMPFAKNGDPVYEIDEAHTPLYNPNETGTQNIAYFQDASAQVHIIPTATGIVFHDLQPAEFWRDTLGFDNNNLVVNLLQDRDGVRYYDGNAAFQKCPRGAVTLDTFTSPIYNRLIDFSINPNPTFFEITETEAVIGSLPLPASQGGYYKVELIGVGLNGNYIDDKTNNANIMGIISTQLDSNNFVTGFGDQSIPYVHRGVPYTISQVRVRITNPDNTPVSTLGDETTCFVQIIPGMDQAPGKQPTANMTNYY